MRTNSRAGYAAGRRLTATFAALAAAVAIAIRVVYEQPQTKRIGE